MISSKLQTQTVLSRLGFAAVLVVSFVFSINTGIAQEKQSKPISVVELFTSQGCYSCPPADEKLAELIASEPNLVALEFHVDYWNDLVWGKDGTWQDPFSKPEYSLRQRQYNKVALKGRTGVYTPQSVINGQYAMVGVDKKKASQVMDASVPVAVTVSVNAVDDQLLVNVDNPDSLQEATIYIAHFLKKTSTDVKGGENNGKQLHNINVVTKYETLGKLSGESEHRFVVASKSDSNTGCAVVVQSADLGPVLGAALCPD